MRAWLALRWEWIRVNFWLLPVLLALASVGLSFGMLALDRGLVADPTSEHEWLYSGGAEGARAVLSTIASSMITVAGVVFSITVVSLTLASSQFGPRLLRAFIRDRGTQLVLGTFVATYLYCLMILRTIRAESYRLFVPNLSVTVGVGLSIVSIGVLIYFIHHVSQMIQAPHIIISVGADLESTLEQLRRRGERAGCAPIRPPPRAADAWPVRAAGAGYVETVDLQALRRIAFQRGLLIHVARRPGDFLLPGLVLALVQDGAEEAKLRRAIAGAFVLGPVRTLAQDVDFAFAQLVEVAVRALSPGINDPFTAAQCIDRLSAVLSGVLRLGPPASVLADAGGRPRVVLPEVTFPELLRTSFDQILTNGAKHPSVLQRMLEALAALSSDAAREEDRAALREHAGRVLRGSESAGLAPYDLADVVDCHARASRVLGAPT